VPSAALELLQDGGERAFVASDSSSELLFLSPAIFPCVQNKAAARCNTVSHNVLMRRIFLNPSTEADGGADLECSGNIWPGHQCGCTVATDQLSPRFVR